MSNGKSKGVSGQSANEDRVVLKEKKSMFKEM